MRLFVSVKPRSRHESVKKIDDTHLVVAVKESPVQGRANDAVIQALAKFFDIAPSRFCIRSGQGGRKKIIEVS
ncbi:MAG: hypothetical protein A2934_03090 [Candidatus Sungbacteria bacterium RIFCSPLOWO2_01_FULL_47_10]|uniref:Uncharacterized protein n=1 Tax=Candidatus Sungbacteria bacterium RIFCSPLOWO2_01_FULL_47_10 TaxID=1802276 RepID=A0A1G2L6J3_9BACT|nr:MAG: hypothetical protein A2934_03090 [Candidatus Sungbacteria bacterium RIFCSPLOWO2_01_FULL_47_10]